jgi:hypothetical protein
MARTSLWAALAVLAALLLGASPAASGDDNYVDLSNAKVPPGQVVVFLDDSSKPMQLCVSARRPPRHSWAPRVCCIRSRLPARAKRCIVMRGGR